MGAGGSKPRHGSPVQNGSVDDADDTRSFDICMWAMVFGATVFGGIHVGAWNFEFPTRIELIFWRCASVFTAAFGLTIPLSALPMFLKREEEIRFLLPPLAFLYIMARLFLLVEIFRSLCFLPPDAYVSTWTTNIPHLT